MRKRNFIYFLSIILIIAMIPVIPFAEESDEATCTSLTSKTSLNEAVKYGTEVYLAKNVTYSGTLGNNDSATKTTVNLNGQKLFITSNSTLRNLIFKNGCVIISGSGCSINNVEFKNGVGIAIEGSGNTFSNHTVFNGYVDISGEGNTFNYVEFATESDVVISGQHNTFRNNSDTEKTVFKGKLLVTDAGDNNTFDNIDFIGSTKEINGNSRFIKGNFKKGNFKDAVVTITDGEFNKVTYNNVESSISNGEFNKGIFEYGNGNFSGGTFNNVEFDDESTKVTGGEFYNPIFYNSNKTEISGNNEISNPIFYERETTSGNKYDISYTEAGTIKTVSTDTSISEILKTEEIKSSTGAVKIVLNKNITETTSIEIGGNQNVIIDLNGHSITSSNLANTIVQYGGLTIMDSSNKDYEYQNDDNDTSSAITVSKGYIDNIHIGSGTLLIRAGSFSTITQAESTGIVTITDLSDLDTYVDTRSSIYKIGDRYYVIDEGNLDYYLCYKILDEDGNEVKSVDSDEIQDISIGEKYTIKVYLKSNTCKAVRLRGFDINMKCRIEGVTGSNINVETPYADINKYYTVSKSELTEGVNTIQYRLNWDDSGKKQGYDANYYIPAALTEEGNPIKNYEGLMIAQLEITVARAVDVSEKIKFEFVEGEQTLAIMKELGGTVDRSVNTTSDNSIVNKVSVNEWENLELNTRNTYDGVTIASYRYAPEGYLLAIVAKEHKTGGEKEYTIAYGDEPMWYTTQTSYINQSTNSENIKADGVSSLGGVYLKLISPEDLVKEGLLEQSNINDTASIAEAVEKKLSIIEGNDEDMNLNLGNILDIDGDVENKIDYNDASLVYQMLQNGGAKWGYDPTDKSNYLSEKSRLLSAAGCQGKLYGTIEDVARIIKNYSSSN